MDIQELKVYSQIGRALWAQPEKSDPISADTLSAVGLLNLPSDRKIEKATSALLSRAIQAGHSSLTESNLSSIANPFYRLEALQRVLLIALHQGRWSYQRLARILDKSVLEVESLAWTARLSLAQPGMSYPSGAKAQCTNCPEYKSDRPWTQRFLDEEFETSRERIFLQNHLMACDPCREALNRCRDFYYSLETWLPPMEISPQFVEGLRGITEYRPSTKLPGEKSTTEMIISFVRGKSDVQVALVLLAVILCIAIFKR